MALLKCEECGGIVRDNAEFCPHCGTKEFKTKSYESYHANDIDETVVETPWYKKTGCLIVAIVLFCMSCSVLWVAYIAYNDYQNIRERYLADTAKDSLSYSESCIETKQSSKQNAIIKFVNSKKVKINDFVIEKTRNGLKLTTAEELKHPSVSTGFNGKIWIFPRYDKNMHDAFLMDGKAVFNFEKIGRNSYETDRECLPQKLAYADFIARANSFKVSRSDMHEFEDYVFYIAIKLDDEYKYEECNDKFCNHDKCKMFRFLLNGLMLK